MTGEISRLCILVDVLGEKDQRLASQVALTDVRGGCVYDSGGRASSALFVKRRRERDTFRADGVLRDDPLRKDGRKERSDAIDPINIRPSARVVRHVCGEDVHESAEILEVKQLRLVGAQLLDVEDVARRAEGKRKYE